MKVLNSHNFTQRKIIGDDNTVVYNTNSWWFTFKDKRYLNLVVFTFTADTLKIFS
jgi:hypothetical protein